MYGRVVVATEYQSSLMLVRYKNILDPAAQRITQHNCLEIFLREHFKSDNHQYNTVDDGTSV